MPSTAKRIAKNTLWLFGADAVSKVSLLVLAILIARQLGDANFGIYAFALAFGVFFTVIADLGLNIFLVRDVARNVKKAGEYIGNLISVKLISSIAAFLLLILIMQFWRYSAQSKLVIYIIGAYLILSSFANMFRYLFNAYELMKYDALVTFIEKSIILIFGALVLIKGYGLLALSLVFLGAGTSALIAGWIITKLKFTDIKLQWDNKFIRYCLKESLPFALIAIMGLIYFKIDTIMLSLMTTDAVVGWYNAAYQIVEGFMFIPILFMSSVLPVMSKLHVNSKKSLCIACEKSFKYLFISVLPIAVGSILISKQIIDIIFGIDFMNSIIILQILMISLIFMFISRPFSYSLAATNNQKRFLYVQIIGSIINISLNIYFIQILGHVGAAITTVITQIFIFASVYLLNKKVISGLRIIGSVFKPVLSVAVMGAVIYYIGERSLILIIPSAIIVYTSMLFLLRTFTKEDIKLFKELKKGQ